jgi:hypothetical protein
LYKIVSRILLGRNVGNGFKEWATTCELHAKREDEWGFYITIMYSFPQNRCQVPQICEDQEIFFVYCFG